MTNSSDIKVMTIGQISEEDYNIYLALKELNIKHVHVDVITRNKGYFINVPDFPHKYLAYGIGIIPDVDLYEPDCIIVRAGWSFDETYIKMLISHCEKESIPIALWCQEQGVNMKFQTSVAKHFYHVFSSNPGDINTYKEAGIEKVDYAPFGVVPSFHKVEKPFDDKYRCDITAFGRMQASTPKLESAKFLLGSTNIDENVIMNNRKYNVKLWGEGWDIYSHWKKGNFPYVDLPKVVRGSRIVLGAHANTSYSLCFGSRLVRVLGCKGFLLWDYTKDMEKEFKNKEGLVWVKRDENPVELIDYYLDNEFNRQKIAANGQQIVYEKYNYLKIIPEMIEKIMGGN